MNEIKPGVIGIIRNTQAPVVGERITLADIRAAFPGYHLRIDIYPAGGMLDVEGCEECGTDGAKFYLCAWRNAEPGRGLEDAVSELQYLIKQEMEK